MSEQDNGVVTPVETGSVQQETEVVEGQTVDQPEEGEPKPEKMLSQEEVNRLIERRIAKERGRTYRKIGNLEAQLAAKREAEAAPQSSYKGGAPQRDSFESYEDYLEAKAEWKADEAVTKRLNGIEQQRVQSANAQRHEAIAEQWEERKAHGQEKYADFDEVAGSHDVRVSDPMAQSIMQSPVGEDLIYHLGKNPKEAERINALSPVRQIAELAKLEAKFEAKPPRTSDAPDPINPVNKGKDPTGNLSDRMPVDDWVKQHAKMMGWRR